MSEGIYRTKQPTDWNGVLGDLFGIGNVDIDFISQKPTLFYTVSITLVLQRYTFIYLLTSKSPSQVFLPVLNPQVYYDL